MRPDARPVLLLAAALAASCATPADPLEEAAARRPSPLARDRLGETAPGAFPASAEDAAGRTLEAAARRGRLTPADCIALAAARSEDLLLGDEARLQALLQGDLAEASALGDLRLLARHDRRDPTGGGGFGPTGGSSSTSEPARSQVALNATQPLFAGFREWNARESSERLAEALEEEREDVRRLLALAVSRAYYSVIEAEAEMAVEEEALALAEERVREMAARAAEGLARRTEVLLQESRRETTRALLLEATERRDRARVVLESLAGVPLGLPFDAAAAPRLPVPDRAGALAGIRRLRPGLRAADSRVAAAALDLEVARGGRWPVVEASGNWYVERRNYSPSAEDERWDLGVTLDLPIFTGGDLDARERIAASRLRQAELALSRAVRAASLEVEDALVRLEAGEARLETLRANERFARENLDLLQGEYRQGLATNLEVLTAQVQVLEAGVALRRQEIRSRLDRVEALVAAGHSDPFREPAPQEKP